MFSIILYQPEIPPNTGAIMRLAANTGCLLHLIEPLGFEMSDTRLKRAGMDYRERVITQVHESLEAWIEAEDPQRVFAFSPLGATWHSSLDYSPGDALLFGPESTGLPEEVMSALWVDETARIPMLPGVRSLNLANAVAIVVYEAWSHHRYMGAV